MILQKLKIANYKVFEEDIFTFDPSINLIYGRNGIGKTNLLDAIYYLSFCKSYNNNIESQNIRHNESFFSIHGYYLNNEVICSFQKKKGKKIKYNSLTYKKLADHIGKIPLIIICPNESYIITMGSEYRRKFIDSVISQYNPNYLNTLIAYNKILLQRNNTLKINYSKNLTYNDLQIWDVKLIEAAKYINTERQEMINTFLPIFANYYKKISDNQEQTKIIYKSQLNDNDYKKLLEDNFQKDKKTQYTNTGIHKDELEFIIDKYSLKKFGSQGQKKSFLIALKIAQTKLIEKKLNMTPIILLDDIYDKLDTQRMKQLIDILFENQKHQIFITDTDKTRIPKLLKAKKLNFKLFKLPRND